MARPHGTKNIKDPQELLDLWEEYKESVGHDEIEQIHPKLGVTTLRVKKPLLRSGFEAFVFKKMGFGISQYLDNNDKAYDDYLGVVTCIRREWETDQISGTMTGKYKAPNLTARLNNITEKTDVTTNGKDLNEVKVTIVTNGDQSN